MLKNFTLRLCALAIFFLLTQNSFAQQISKNEVLDLIKQNRTAISLSDYEINNSIVSDTYFDKVANSRIVYLQQAILGVPVYNSIIVFAFKNNSLEAASGNFVAKAITKIDKLSIVPGIASDIAIKRASFFLQIGEPGYLKIIKGGTQKTEYESSGISKENITTELLWVPSGDSIKLAWQVKILPFKTSDYWLVLVDAQNGNYLGKDNLTVSCQWEKKEASGSNNILKNKVISEGSFSVPFAINSAAYRVIPFPAESMNHPGGTPVVKVNPWLLAGAGSNAISLGWQNDGSTEYNYTRGNNVWAKEDVAGNNGTGSSAISTTAIPDLNFNFIFNSSLLPTSPENQKFAITQLFYWNNLMHDISYQYGFDEPAGNFQNNNLGRGGAGNDFVFADAQDGSSTNNADFSTPGDGSPPRMQMYLFDGVNTKLFLVNAPASLAGYKTAIEGSMSTNNLLINVGNKTGNLVLFNDDATGTSHFACGSAFNAAALNGNIALIERGNCNFSIKVKNAQLGGAIAAVIINNVPNEVISMGGTDNSINIPAVMISLEDGNAIKSEISLSQIVNITLTGSDSKLDGDLDNGIMAHEYTHGISTRLTGGPSISTCLNNKEQMGEGWSDYFSLMTTTNWNTALISDGPKPRPIGTYVFGEDPETGAGIRTYPYSTNMGINIWNYDMLSGIVNSETHQVGEIWAATLWDMTWNIIQTDGINIDLYKANDPGGNSVALKLVMLGMKLQPCRPGFIDGRDAILKADTILYNGLHGCAIWSAFARRGMGILAQQGSSNSTTDQLADYTSPSAGIVKKLVDKITSAQSELLTYTFRINTLCAPITGYKIVDTLPLNVTYVSGGTYDASGRTVIYNVPDLAANSSITFTLQVTVNTGTYFVPSILFSETVPSNSIPATMISTSSGGSKWATNSTNHSSPYSIKSASPASASEQFLTSANAYNITGHTQLSFWGYYNTEASHDGGVVELSTDNGVNWKDAGPFMSQNGYNAIMNSNTNITNNRAFTGSNGGFMQTVINLTAFKGQNIKFRFRFVTDNTISGIGWYVDDILLSREPAVYNLGQLYNGSGNLVSLSDTVTAITSVALPLKWESFTAVKQNKEAVLSWVTYQEINTDHFSVERSSDGIHFYSINILLSAGNALSNSSYFITDHSPAYGINYYRIAQFDRSGKVGYSPIRTLEFEMPGNRITITPNPAKDKLMVTVENNVERLNVTVVNAMGETLLRYFISQEKNQLDVTSLPSGIYFLKISGRRINEVRKVVKK
ncbi:MAG: M36 family metallopeptidase [Ginsengibacter sp.]